MNPGGLALGGDDDWFYNHTAPPLVALPAADITGPANATGADEKDGDRYFPGLEEWVVDWLAPTVRRQHNENAFRWCPQWWAHAEAISRLNGLWEAWENARTEGAVALLGWWQVLDHHLTILTSTGGPFAQCAHTGHRSDGTPLTTVPAPADTWAQE